MKIDIDSIFYVILMIIILVVSGLGSRRRKRAQQMNKPIPSGARPVTKDPEEIKIPQPRRPALDPFSRLEQILTGQSPEVMEDEELTIIDDQEEYLAEPVPQQEAHEPDFTAETEDDQGKKSLDGLFRDADEITRAIIYSEILPRKYI